mmetsp:Transcript_52427/g.119556  ORF Transcript_52427/g.119556 Transcript_52427/m.119556 type:complete len:240 (-) Transcript_52427:84-803(-)
MSKAQKSTRVGGGATRSASLQPASFVSVPLRTVPLTTAPVVRNNLLWGSKTETLPLPAQPDTAVGFRKYDETVVSRSHSLSTSFVYGSDESFTRRVSMEPDTSFMLVAAQRPQDINSGNDSPSPSTPIGSKKWVFPEEAISMRSPVRRAPPDEDRLVKVDVFVHSALLSRWPKHVLTLRVGTTVRSLEQALLSELSSNIDPATALDGSNKCDAGEHLTQDFWASYAEQAAQVTRGIGRC